MIPLMRAITYAVLFIALVLLFLPARVLDWLGVARTPAIGSPQVAGAITVVVGGALALWCVLTFAFVGRGTPAPFDPPRRLVASGPYQFVRNPMYVGAGLALAGIALFYESLLLLGLTLLFLLVAHLFVLLYEEPTLRRLFGAEYEAYCRRVRRWWPAGLRSGN